MTQTSTTTSTTTVSTTTQNAPMAKRDAGAGRPTRYPQAARFSSLCKQPNKYITSVCKCVVQAKTTTVRMPSRLSIHLNLHSQLAPGHHHSVLYSVCCRDVHLEHHCNRDLVSLFQPNFAALMIADSCRMFTATILTTTTIVVTDTTTQMTAT